MLLLYGAARVPPALHRPTAPRLALALAFALCSPSLAAAPAKPDPKASKSVPTKPDPKKPDPKASKSAPKKPDPKKPDPKASKSVPTKSDPKKPDPKQPAPKQPDPKPELNQPVPTPPPIPAPGAGGYWLGARLLGPGAVPALAAMSPGTGGDGGPDSAIAGQVPTMPEAMAWVARWAFAGPALPAPSLDPADSPIHTGPAPIPGGELYRAHHAILQALTIRGRSLDNGLRAIRWPTSAAELTPPGATWLPAVLLAERAPLFSAPSHRVPPAAERYAFARKAGSLWLLGHLDRCSNASGERVCLRWAQVISRDGDEFHAGYLPASQVATVDGWRRGAGAAPRAQLLASGTTGARAQFVLVARTREGGLHRRTLEAPLVHDAYPAARLRIDGEWATVEFAGAPAQRIALDTSMDARVR